MPWHSIPHSIPQVLNYCVYHTIGMQQNLDWMLRHGERERPEITYGKTSVFLVITQRKRYLK